MGLLPWGRQEVENAAGQVLQGAFGRKSIDDAGVRLLSSIHFGTNYNNAMWNGHEMLYGDGDGKLFTDFTKGTDAIGRELTHGVTQYTLQLDYSGDAGGPNESISDCFGSMFRQWQLNQTAPHLSSCHAGLDPLLSGIRFHVNSGG